METETEHKFHYSKSALALMHKHDVAPDPVSYAVWYHYAQGKKPGLVREVDNILDHSLKFSQETYTYLHNKYLADRANQQAIDEAANDAHKLLAKVLKVVQDFSGGTQSYVKDVDQYLDSICTDFTDDNIKAVFKQLIDATIKLRDGSKKINEQALESTTEIDHLRQHLQQVTREARYDFLTGLLNRQAFELLVDQQLLAAVEKKAPLCLLMLDIDRFKQFNDRFGHLLGDEVLKIVARTLTGTLKGRDVAARFGGEEFIVILPETPLEGAMKVAELIRCAIADKELKRKDTGEPFGTITVSVGVACYRPETDTLPTLIARADEALYKSKFNGRNCITRETLAGAAAHPKQQAG